MEPNVTFRNWRGLAREGRASFLFQGFRPNGEGLANLFSGVVGSSDVLPRLLEVYEATSSGYVTDSGEDAYFIVRNPPPISEADLHALTHRHLMEANKLVCQGQSSEISSLFDPLPNIEIVNAEIPEQAASAVPDVLLLELVNDLVLSSTPTNSDFFLLEEAFYHINCDYLTRHYLLWPLYRTALSIADPFLPYFDLWKHGARPVWEENRVVKVYAPNRA
jgi:hypothetical protein